MGYTLDCQLRIGVPLHSSLVEPVAHNSGPPFSARSPSRQASRVRLLRIETDLRALGGVGTAAELISRGHTADMLRLWSDYGRIVKVRKGVYVERAASPDVVEALRVGGRLACISAAVHLGLIDGTCRSLHISVPREMSRLRTRHNARRKLTDFPDESVVLHWSRTAPAGDRQSVSADTALSQMSRCAHPDTWSAIGETAANR